MKNVGGVMSINVLEGTHDKSVSGRAEHSIWR
jgi:hypothetical protein